MLRARIFVVYVYTQPSVQGELRGVVEPVRVDAKLTFRSLGELHEIMCMSASALKRRASLPSPRTP